MFSILSPGTIIKPHRGAYRGALRCHLGLSCPTKEEGCVLTVSGEQHGWEDGKCLVWDDTYVHEVQNNTNKDRVILFMDINRPIKGMFSQQIQKNR